MKHCKKCDTKKSKNEFSANRAKFDGLQPWCKSCKSTHQKEANPSVRKGYHLKHMFGITIEDYNTMLEDQEGACAICKKPEDTKSLAVDHDHTTGRVRGLLCAKCNKAIGLLQDNENLLYSAIDYLRYS